MKTNSYIPIVVIVVALLLASCAGPAPLATVLPADTQAAPQPSPTPTATAPQPSPTMEASAELTPLLSRDYTLPEFSFMLPDTGGVIRLQDGEFDYPIPNSAATVHVQFVNGALGDLNSDGLQDAVAVLAVNSGGSGTFVYLIALNQQDGALIQTGSLPLGDRVQLKSLAIQDGVIEAQLVTHAAGDPQCCPTVEVTNRYRLVEGHPVAEDQAGVLEQALAAMKALESHDMQSLSAMVHPTQGLRFSPYAYVRDEDLVFSAEQVVGLMDDPTEYTWGAFDGSGLPIQMTYPTYDQHFVYSTDFAQPDEISINKRIGMGNSIDNSQEYYPESAVVEFYRAPQDPKYGGLDWQSLRLVFQPDGDAWRLVGVIHDEWTT